MNVNESLIYLLIIVGLLIVIAIIYYFVPDELDESKFFFNVTFVD